MGDHVETIKSAVIGGKHAEIKSIVQSAIDAGLDPNTIINDALIPAMDVVGKDFGSGKIFVPEMLVSAVTMKAGLDIVKPLLAGGQSQSRGTVIMATVKGDLHDIGKNLVTMMLEGAGFKVVDLGVDLTPPCRRSRRSSVNSRLRGCATRSRSWWAGRRWTAPSQRRSARTVTVPTPPRRSSSPAALPAPRDRSPREKGNSEK